MGAKVWFVGTKEWCAAQQELMEVSSAATWCSDEDVMKGVFATTWLQMISWCWSFVYVFMGSAVKVDADWEKCGHRNVSHFYLHHLFHNMESCLTSWPPCLWKTLASPFSSPHGCSLMDSAPVLTYIFHCSETCPKTHVLQMAASLFAKMLHTLQDSAQPRRRTESS